MIIYKRHQNPWNSELPTSGVLAFEMIGKILNSGGEIKKSFIENVKMRGLHRKPVAKSSYDLWIVITTNTVPHYSVKENVSIVPLSPTSSHFTLTLGEKSVGSSPRQSNDTRVLNLLSSWACQKSRHFWTSNYKV